MRTELQNYRILFDGQEDNEVPEELIHPLERIRRDEALFQDYLDVSDHYRDIGRSDKEMAALELALALGHENWAFYRLALNRAMEGQYAEAYRYIKRMNEMHGMAKLLYLRTLDKLGKTEKARSFWQLNRKDSELREIIRHQGLDDFSHDVRRMLKDEG